MSKSIDIDDPEFQTAVRAVMDEMDVDRAAAEFIVAARCGGKGDVYVVDDQGNEFSISEIQPVPSGWRPISR